jgi:hypothetical protein
MATNLENINNKISEDIHKMFEEANVVPYNPNTKYISRRASLRKGEDIAKLFTGNFITVHDYFSTEDESN